jgi:hypothetical protein
MPNVKKHEGRQDHPLFAADEYEALKDADALIIATEWAEFRTPDLERVGSLKERVIFDGRNLYELETMKEQGLHLRERGPPTVNVPVHHQNMAKKPTQGLIPMKDACSSPAPPASWARTCATAS